MRRPGMRNVINVDARAVKYPPLCALILADCPVTEDAPNGLSVPGWPGGEGR